MSFTDAERREIAAVASLSAANRSGIVTGWQAVPPMAKVQIMPWDPADGTPPETGWIPVLSSAAGFLGNGWRVLIPPMIGAQAFIQPEVGNAQNWVITGFYFSDVDPAPAGAQPGEIMIENENGAQVYLKADGAITLVTPTLNIGAPNGGEATVNITGSLNVTRETTTADIAFTPHTHPYNPGGNPETQTGEPQG
jgi:phage baseplate assembly protein gpV